MGDDYQYDLFRKPRQRPTILCDDFSLYDDIMPNFTRRRFATWLPPESGMRKIPSDSPVPAG